jgi:tetratricopeptide (TPR) repeat protein
MAKTPIPLVLVCTTLFTLLAAAEFAPNPQDAARLNNIGVAYMNQQLFEKALKAFDEAAADDPALEVTAVNRGVALLNLQRIDDAKALLEKAVKDNPKDAHAWYNLGLYYKNSADASAAVDAFRRVTEIDANDADTWYFLGSTYAQLKQFPEAIAAFEHALKLDPHHASAQFGLARAYQQSGQADPAHEAMKKFQYITQNKLGSPISLSYGEQGKYSRAEESPMAVEKVPAEIPVRFVDVTQSAGMPVTGSSAVCFIDYDNDGRIDLFLGGGGASGGSALLHNLGEGKFEDATQKLGLSSTEQGAIEQAAGCTVGDYDNDGFPDLAISTSSGIHLLRNDKAMKFIDVTQAAGIISDRTAGSSGVVWRSLNFVDYDHDGDLDLLGIREAWLPIIGGESKVLPLPAEMWRNNGNGTFRNVTIDLGLLQATATNSIGTDYNNDRAVDFAVTSSAEAPTIFENQREGKFLVRQPWSSAMPAPTTGLAVLDFNHDGWMDFAFTHTGPPGITLWRNNQGKSFDQVPLPKVDWVRAYGVAALDYDNDGWVDLVAVGETKDGKGEVRLFRNLGPDGWKDVTVETGLDKIQLKNPRAIITGDYDNDGAVDLLITQNHGPAVLLHNEGGNKNNSLRLALKGLNDNKSAIGTKVEVFSDGIRQKFEVYGSSGYLGQNSPYLTIGLGQAKQADVVRMLWPTGVLQDEIEVPANKLQKITELDRRGSSCPTLFAWDGHEYKLVGDMLGAGVVGH